MEQGRRLAALERRYQALEDANAYERQALTAAVGALTREVAALRAEVGALRRGSELVEQLVLPLELELVI
jgi:hypothetical protein